jgi:hypothetical protein
MAGGAKARRLLLAGALLLLRLLGLPWATAAVRRSDFPASFLFGTATSSYQVIPSHHRPLDLSFALLPPSLARPMQIDAGACGVFSYSDEK